MSFPVFPKDEHICSQCWKPEMNHVDSLILLRKCVIHTKIARLALSISSMFLNLDLIEHAFFALWFLLFSLTSIFKFAVCSACRHRLPIAPRLPLASTFSFNVSLPLSLVPHPILGFLSLLFAVVSPVLCGTKGGTQNICWTEGLKYIFEGWHNEDLI